MNLTHLINTYWAVVFLVAAESLGVPLPGETALIVAGAYTGHPTGSHLGSSSP